MTLTKEVSNVKEQGKKAKKAAKTLCLLTTDEKNRALLTLAQHLEENYEKILEANERDLQKGREQNFEEAFMDRLALSKERVHEFAEGLRNVAKLDDPVGEELSSWTLDNGLGVKTVRVPLGVIGMIYEARPNVTVDATGLALKSGNAIILKGGSSALHSNGAIVDVIHEALDQTKIPRDAVQFISTANREATSELFTMKDEIDVLIPRGGASLINTVVNNASVPVLETGVGNCHLYVDHDADVKKALNIIINAKTDRPAVCNAAETLILHEEWLQSYQDELKKALSDAGITVHGDDKALAVFNDGYKAEEKDWKEEYLSLDLAIKVVSNIDEAIEHIEKYGTKHSEAIITENAEAANKFTTLVDAAALYHNASTRFTDGGALGFGAEIGISTQKLHARGPMGLPALTTVKYVMNGTGQIR
ncbi:glutamate-5-semialdehyde dehydrogenase [Priestia endophytica]|jgi:glutamate-5-semialdehyde dehydrogenase|uniref:glutamate-5-semialdehyde dehydrogenase n=1 Tax=Priestia endophytica TaxID=135735 RepID=UPI000DCA6471|nr:glutamate-5-semialdehyde dehydrogenase [Priestia endophytica]MCM3538586.1 glutamate-5-semialdehyde dehydrogenase [Priestia endophytica]RAS91655.1 glutamate-5-semialdehyde dehydrogenase [Priestia endophytica]